MNLMSKFSVDGVKIEMWNEWKRCSFPIISKEMFSFTSLSQQAVEKFNAEKQHSQTSVTWITRDHTFTLFNTFYIVRIVNQLYGSWLHDILYLCYPKLLLRFYSNNKKGHVHLNVHPSLAITDKRFCLIIYIWQSTFTMMERGILLNFVKRSRSCMLRIASPLLISDL